MESDAVVYSGATLLAAGFSYFAWHKFNLNSSGRRSAPTTVFYWRPWTGSANQIRQDADGFFARNVCLHGPVFKVFADGSTFVYVTDPDLIATIYKEMQAYAMSPLQAQWAKNIFGFTDEFLTSPIMGSLMIDMHRSLGPKLIQPLCDSLISQLCAYRIHPLSKRVSLWDVIRRVTFETSSKTFFGSSFSSIEDIFWAFNEQVPKVAFGYPPHLVAHFMENREAVVDFLQAHLEASSDALDASNLVGSLQAIASSGGWPLRSITRFLLALLWPLMANVPYAIFWVIALQLRHPQGLRPLIEEVDLARKNYPSLSEFLMSKEELPWLSAAIQETLRYASSSYSIRQVIKEGGVQLGNHVLQHGEHVVCVTRSVHLSDKIYVDPQIYKPERFLLASGKFCGTPSTGGYLPFGGGVSMCEGRHYAHLEMRATLAYLLAVYDIQLAGATSVSFSNENRGFGMIRPAAETLVMITKR